MKHVGFAKNIILVITSLLFIFLLLEFFCRIFVDFDEGYYTSIKKEKSDKFINHPYGKIPINKHGFFDEEFNFENKKEVIAYFGDSVTYGVGAGYPYRFTEYLDTMGSKFQHINISGGLGISLKNWNEQYEMFLINNNIQRIVYMMNMNDIAPLSYNPVEEKSSDINPKNIKYIKKTIKPIDDLLRGRSTFYTYLRFLIKNEFIKLGYEASGFKSIELFPKKNEKNLIVASKKIDQWLNITKKKGFKSCVVILPYEMQISQDAEDYYKSINIKFEKNFVNFSTQKLIKKYLKNSDYFFIIDKAGFEEKNIGHYFVFDKGDKIDFNHPNREGHLSIAKEIFNKKVCQS